MKKNNLRENIDYIKNKNGELVFTKEYLLSRGQCCKSGCLNCPYQYHENIDPNIPQEFSSGWTDTAAEEEESED